MLSLLLIALLVSLVALFVWRPGIVFEYTLAAGALTATWNGVRIPFDVTLADPLLLAGAAGLLPRIAKRRLSVPYDDYQRFAVLFITGGLVGAVATRDLSPNATGRLVISFAAMAIVADVIRHDSLLRRRLLLIFAVGASMNAGSILIGLGQPYGDRQMGLSNHPNHFGFACCLGLFSLLAFWAKTTKMRWISVLFGCQIIVLFIAISSSGSRGAILLLLAGLLFALVSLGGRSVPLAVVVALVAGPLIIWLQQTTTAGSSAISRLLAPGRTEATSSAERLNYWGEAVTRFTNRPLTGWGFSDALLFHSMPLQVAVTSGLLGVLSLFFFLRYILRVLALGFGQSRSGEARWLAAGVGGALVFLLTSNNVYDRYLLLFFALAGTASAARRRPARADDSEAGSTILNANQSLGVPSRGAPSWRRTHPK